MAALTPQQQYEMSQKDKVEHSTQATTSQTTSEANSQSQAKNETPTQSANEKVVTETPDFGNYSTPSIDLSFLDDSNGSEFQIGEDTSKDFVADYNRDLYEIAQALNDEDLGESAEQVKNYLEKYKDEFAKEPKSEFDKEIETYNTFENDEKEYKEQKQKIESSIKQIFGEDANYDNLEKYVEDAENDFYYIRDTIGKDPAMREGHSAKVARGEDITLSDGSKISHNKDGSWTIELPNGNKYTSEPNYDENGTRNDAISILDTDNLDNNNYKSAYEKAVKNNEIYNDNKSAIKNLLEAKKHNESGFSTAKDTKNRYEELKNLKKDKLIQAYKNGEIDLGQFQKKLDDEITVVPIETYDSFDDLPKEVWDEINDPNKQVELLRKFKDISELYDNKIEELDKITFDDNTQLEDVSNQVSENIDTFSKEANELLIDMMGNFVDLTEDKYKEFYNSKEFSDFRNKILQYGQAAKEKINQIRTEAEKQGYSKEEGLKKVRNDVERALNKIKLQTKLSKDEAYNIDSWLRSLDASESVAESLIASAAWNGAEDIKGSEYVENWKDSKFFDSKAILAAGARGALGLLVATVGFGLLAVNPALAAVTIGIGAATFSSSSVKAAVGQEEKETSNRDIMFNPNKKKSIDLYNQLYAPYNIGDTRAVSTYTEGVSIASEAATGLSSLVSNPLGGAVMLADAGKKAKRLLKGSTDAKLDEMYQNVFNAAVYFDNAFGTDLESRFDINIEENTEDDENKDVSSSFDIDTDSFPVEGKYSGYRENAKDSNVAKNYNAGMEKEANEVVSDKYCKIFKTMLDKEPDYIRKVLIAIPKNHAESEW